MTESASLPSWAPRYLSYSAASTVDQCPRRWVYRYRDKIKGTPKRHLLFGTYVHAVCEHSARDGIHEPAALKELARRLFNEEVTPSDDWCYLWPDETEFRREAWQHIVRVKRAEQAGWLGEPRWLEMKLDLTLNGVPFFGFIDRVDVENEIILPTDYKGLTLDTPLATPTGWTTMGAVQVGDQLFDIDGRPTTVTAKSEVHMNPCYRVCFDDTSELIADHEHRWLVTEKDGSEVIRTTEEIAERLSHRRWDGERERFVHPTRIRVAGPLDLPEVDLPIDPYVLGLWLADGHIRGDGLTVSESKLGAVEELQRRGFSSHEPDWSRRQRETGKTKGIFFAVPGLAAALRSAGVLGHREIPDVFLRASEHQRLSLLRGLMDGDGSYNTTRKQAVFSTVSKTLGCQVHELVLSLGWRAVLNEATSHGFGLDVTTYQVTWRPWRTSPFLGRSGKDHLPLSPGRDGGYRRIRSVERVETVPTQCISVDAPTRTYLAGHSMIATHNTGKVDSYLAPRARSPQLQAKMEKDVRKKLYQNPIYGAALARTSDLPIGDGRFVFTSTDPVTIVPSPKSLEGEALDWLAGCWDKVQEAAKLGDDAKACTSALCSWCDAVDVCPEGRKHVAWMLTSTKQDGSPHKVSDDTLAMLKVTPDLQEWVKFGRQPGAVPVEINARMEVRRPDPFRARPDEPPLDEPSVGELRGWLMEATQSQRPNVERIRHLEWVLRRRGFEVERWEPSEAQLAPPKPKRRRKLQSASAKAKAKAEPKKTTRRRKAAKA